MKALFSDEPTLANIYSPMCCAGWIAACANASAEAGWVTVTTSINMATEVKWN
jgi:hypothetical protein